MRRFPSTIELADHLKRVGVVLFFAGFVFTCVEAARSDGAGVVTVFASGVAVTLFLAGALSFFGHALDVLVAIYDRIPVAPVPGFEGPDDAAWQALESAPDE